MIKYAYKYVSREPKDDRFVIPKKIRRAYQELQENNPQHDLLSLCEIDSIGAIRVIKERDGDFEERFAPTGKTHKNVMFTRYLVELRLANGKNSDGTLKY